MPSSTSSIRIPNELRERLERTAKHLKKGKNSIIVEALDEYLKKTDPVAFAEEARRQSSIAAAAAGEDDRFWESIADTRGWK
jgi:predicted DNA-binding protein